MRLVCALLLAGCTDGIAPPSLQDEGVPDLSDEDFSVDAGEPDLLQLVDLADTDAFRDLAPASCRTACDCPSGQACKNNACSPSTPQVFCCGTAQCSPTDATCQAADGRFSQCGVASDAGVQPDAGSSGGCANTTCIQGVGSQLFCQLACGTSTATCGGPGSTKHCSP